MKIIILAAGTNKYIDFPKPKCLLPYRGGTILSYQINLLNSLGIKNKDIILVIGGQGKEWNDDNRKEIMKLHDNIIVNQFNTQSRNSLSLLMAIKDIEDNLIVLDGDVVLDSNIIKQLLETENKNIIVSRIVYSISEKGGKVEVADNEIRGVGEFLRPKSYPWYIHSGLIRINRDTILDLKRVLSKNPGRDILDNINILLDKHKFLNLDYSNKNRMIDKVNLKGGSYATLEKFIVVRKEARGKGVQKIKNEIEWLNRLPKGIRNKFTQVRHYGIDKDYAWFEMNYHQLPCLRELILENKIQSQDTIKVLETVLDFMFKEVYTRGIIKNKGGWIWDKHIVRVNSRLIETSREAPIFDKITKAEKIIFNGIIYDNIPFLIKELCERPSFLKKMEPKYLRMVHGDLHFQNILIDIDNINNFILTDPRGELFGSDLYYDMGKLWHSFEGLYDFIHTGRFSLKVEFENKFLRANLEYNSLEIKAEYEKVRKVISKNILKYKMINKDVNWNLKILFSEAMHFSSLMPFHLARDNKEIKAIAMYLTGVKLLNDLFIKFNIKNISKEKRLANINSNRDYMELLKQNKI
jgi:choline kinase